MPYWKGYDYQINISASNVDAQVEGYSKILTSFLSHPGFNTSQQTIDFYRARLLDVVIYPASFHENAGHVGAPFLGGDTEYRSFDYIRNKTSYIRGWEDAYRSGVPAISSYYQGIYVNSAGTDEVDYLQRFGRIIADKESLRSGINGRLFLNYLPSEADIENEKVYFDNQKKNSGDTILIAIETRAR